MLIFSYWTLKIIWLRGGKKIAGSANLIYKNENWVLLVSLKLENDWTDFANFGFEIFVEV